MNPLRPQINFSAHPDDAEELKALAKLRGVPMRELVVQALLGRPAKRPMTEADSLREENARLRAELDQLRAGATL